ncbi:GDP-L-fucose synthase [Dasania marina]|uniref:GDP-L-fucose synthase n=1 Tax=Dasania marina TaxID=471499 RepID=UPI0030DC52DD|tara:strand:- start:34589 stop:35554 length:966 start_codon:yes stop_codon:yes gene_type:complete
MNKKRVYIAGHNGMVGSAIVRQLQNHDDVELVLRSRKELDLVNQGAVADFFKAEKIDEVYLAAAKVGGIVANNTYPADFIYENLMIQSNIINSAHKANIERLLFLGSSCIYPKQAGQPMSENALLTGSLEETNEPYAVAKIAGIKLCESYNRQYGKDYRSVMPTNLYGPNDNFHPENSHVIPAMMRRFHEAKIKRSETVGVWGTGNPMREFLCVDDMAKACLHVMGLPRDKYKAVTRPMLSHLNVGTGFDISIRDLANTMAEIVGFSGEIVFDESKPDGSPRKLMNVDRLAELGWSSTIELAQGLKDTYKWYLENVLIVRG